MDGTRGSDFTKNMEGLYVVWLLPLILVVLIAVILTGLGSTAVQLPNTTTTQYDRYSLQTGIDENGVVYVWDPLTMCRSRIYQDILPPDPRCK